MNFVKHPWLHSNQRKVYLAAASISASFGKTWISSPSKYAFVGQIIEKSQTNFQIWLRWHWDVVDCSEEPDQRMVQSESALEHLEWR